MQTFIHDDFLLQTDTARMLYHEHAAGQPVIDYHCHLNPAEIAADRQWDNLGQIWLEADHYKWRVMRANGVNERFITGDASWREKFDAWAATVPHTMRNPLYHWTHLELKTAFGIDETLSPASADRIFERCSELLRRPEFSARGLLRRYRVETVCTTDDPADSLEHHITIVRDESCKTQTLPTWRPDRAMTVEQPAAWRSYINRLSAVAGVTINSFGTLIEALRLRHDFFANAGCCLSDHGFDRFYSDRCTTSEANAIFRKVFGGGSPNDEETAKFKSAMLRELSLMDCEKGWTQQFHYGVVRNNNSRMFGLTGADAGFDSIADGAQARPLLAFLDSLDREGRLAKTIVYNLNPADNAMLASALGNFQEGPVAGKMQFGAAWWFLDHQKGIEEQLNTLSAFGLLSRFVGMLTDSRSFLSFPRHDFFRRILCNMLGNDVEKGLLPKSELQFIGQMVENISYRNAKEYFGF